MADEKKSVIIDLKFNVSEFSQNAAKLNKEIADLNKQQSALKKANQEGSIEFQRNDEILKANRIELTENNKVIQNLTIANKANEGSNQQLKAQLSLLTLEYNKLSKSERETGERGKELNALINQTTTDLKANEKGIGDNRREVGNYGMIMKDLKKEMMSAKGEAVAMGAAYGLTSKEFIDASAKAGQLADKLKETNEAAKVFTTGSKFEAFGNSLKGVGSDLSSLDFEGAAEKAKTLLTISKSMTFKEAIKGMKSVGQTIISVGKAMLKNPYILIATALVGLGLAAKDMFDTFKAGDKILEETRKKMREVGLETESLKNKNRDATLQRKLDNGEITQAAFNAAKTQNKLGDEVLENERKRRDEKLKIEQEFQEQKSSIMSGVLKALNASGGDLVEIEMAKKKNQALLEIDASYNDKKKQLISNNATERFANVQSENRRIKDENDKLNEDNNKKYADSLKKKEDEDQKAYDERIKAQIEFQATQVELNAEAAQFELNEFIRNHQSKIDSNKFLNDEMYAQELIRLENVSEANIDYQNRLLENELITVAQHQENLKQIAFDAQAEKDALAEEKKIADEEQSIVDKELQFELDVLENENIFAIQQQELEKKHQAELDAAEKTGADKKLIDEKYAKFKKQLDVQQAQTSIGAAANAFGEISSMLGEGSEEAKGFAIFAATMNAVNSIISILGATSIVPEPFGSILKGISAAAVGVSAYRQVDKIKNMNPPKKAAKGGIFGGESHDNGGTKGWFSDGTQIEVERGELFAVVNKTNTAMLNQLSALNSFGGNGVSFGGSKSYLADGGIGFTSSSTKVENQNNSVEQLVNSLREMPPQVVVVQDINEIQAQTNRTEVRAML